VASILLIHGSWHGAWCWHKIVPRLVALGHTVFAPDLPGHGRDWTRPEDVTMKSCVDALLPILEASSERMTVVAHSRGGIVLTALAERMPEKISSAVYLAAVLLENGQTVFDIASHAGGSLILPNMYAAEDMSWDMLREDAFDEALYADCSVEDRALCHALLTPEPLGPSLTPTSTSADRFGSVRKVYIELTEDRAVPPAWQRFMCAAVRCDEIRSIAAGHSAYFSKPEELAGLIGDVAAVASAPLSDT
jgi:pimeloyl-ACP methyl ester carboxylesterase